MAVLERAAHLIQVQKPESSWTNCNFTDEKMTLPLALFQYKLQMVLQCQWPCYCAYSVMSLVQVGLVYCLARQRSMRYRIHMSSRHTLWQCRGARRSLIRIAVAAPLSNVLSECQGLSVSTRSRRQPLLQTSAAQEHAALCNSAGSRSAATGRHRRVHFAETYFSRSKVWP